MSHQLKIRLTDSSNPQTPNPKPQTPKPKTPKPQTPIPKPEIPNPCLIEQTDIRASRNTNLRKTGTDRCPGTRVLIIAEHVCSVNLAEAVLDVTDVSGLYGGATGVPLS